MPALLDDRLHAEKWPASAAWRRRGWAYAHARYAEALHEFGTPREVPRSGGWLLERAVQGSDALDAMGCYPLFSCTSWAHLGADLEELCGRLTSVTLVADPFAPVDRHDLEQLFDLVRPMKRHYIVDLTQPLERIVSRHHRRAARRALEHVSISVSEHPGTLLAEWNRLYRGLVERKGLSGIHAFSHRSFEAQLELPGSRMFVASHDGETVGADWYLLDGDVCYAHLGACTEAGYGLGAAYALQWHALERLREETLWVDLGGVAGLADDTRDGLAFFKRGWATHVVPVYLCGRVLDPERYADLTRRRGVSATEYFPAYREGEFS